MATHDLPNPRDVMTIKQAYSIGKSVESTANTSAIAAAKSIFGYKIVLNSIPDTATSANNLLTNIDELSDEGACSLSSNPLSLAPSTILMLGV